MIRVAVLDDWQGVARRSADWRPLEARAEVAFFNEPFASVDAIAAGLADFDVVVAMRERTAFPGALISRLPRLRMIALTGARTRSIDIDACTARGIVISHTGGDRASNATAELALALLLAAARHVPAADASMRAGLFQRGVPTGMVLEGRTLGVVGLGRIGARVARFGQALGMRVLAWSENLTEMRAQEVGVERVDKDTLLAQSDAVTLHLVLAERTRGILGRRELALMRPGTLLINTSRGPLVDEAALLDALRAGRLRAALDVYGQEPLPADHPLRGLPNVVLTPHIGYCTDEIYAQFYGESIENVLAFLDGRPVRLLNPPAPGIA